MSETNTSAATTGAGDAHLVVAHLRSQRAYRKLRPDPVPDDVIEAILTAATWAPSAKNTQPWEWIVLTDPEPKEAVAAVNRAAWQRGGRQNSVGTVPDGMLESVDTWAMTGLAQAPVIIVACVDLDAVGEISAASSMFPAIQNLMLAAQAHGLGTLLSTLPVVDKGKAVGEALGIPAHVRPLAIVPVGYPERQLGPSRRIPVAEKTHRNRFGNAW